MVRSLGYGWLATHTRQSGNRYLDRLTREGIQEATFVRLSVEPATAPDDEVLTAAESYRSMGVPE